MITISLKMDDFNFVIHLCYGNFKFGKIIS